VIKQLAQRSLLKKKKTKLNKLSQMLENNNIACTKEKEISKGYTLTIESRIMATYVEHVASSKDIPATKDNDTTTSSLSPVETVK